MHGPQNTKNWYGTFSSLQVGFISFKLQQTKLYKMLYQFYQFLIQYITLPFPVRRAYNLTTFMCRLSLNLGDSAAWNPRVLSRPVMRLLYLYISFPLYPLITAYHGQG